MASKTQTIEGVFSLSHLRVLLVLSEERRDHIVGTHCVIADVVRKHRREIGRVHELPLEFSDRLAILVRARHLHPLDPVRLGDHSRGDVGRLPGEGAVRRDLQLRGARRERQAVQAEDGLDGGRDLGRERVVGRSANERARVGQVLDGVEGGREQRGGGGDGHGRDDVGVAGLVADAGGVEPVGDSGHVLDRRGGLGNDLSAAQKVAVLRRSRIGHGGGDAPDLIGALLLDDDRDRYLGTA